VLLLLLTQSLALPYVVKGQLDFIGADSHFTSSRMWEEIRLTENDGVTPLAGASGYGLRGAVRSVSSGALALDLTPYLSWSTTEPETLVIDVPKSANSLLDGKYVYDIVVVDGANESVLLYGDWHVLARNTPP
jgi:hypothetical protein